jgi:hypothetical protein
MNAAPTFMFVITRNAWGQDACDPAGEDAGATAALQFTKEP